MLHICVSQKNDAHYLKDVSFQYHDVSLLWGKRSKDAGLISAAVSSLNNFTTMYSFLSYNDVSRGAHTFFSYYSVLLDIGLAYPAVY
jgi:hypothetical protein